MPLRQLNVSGQGTNVIPVKGVQMAPLPNMVKKPLQLDATGRLVMPQVQATPHPVQQMPQQTPQQTIQQGQPQIQGSIMPDTNPRINEIRNILGTATPEDTRISEIQAIMSGQNVTPQTQEQSTGIGYKVGEFAKDVAKSVVRPFATPFAGFISGIQGLRGKDTEIQLPGWLGDARGSGDLNKQARIAAGASLEAASLLPAGKALTGLRQVGTTPLRQLALQEAKYGALVGSAGAAGYELSQGEDPTMGSVLGAGALGAGLGAALGITAPAVGRFIQKYVTKGNKILNKSEQQLAQKYDDTLGTLKFVKETDQKLQQQAQALGMKPMTTGELLLREGTTLGSKEIDGKLIFKTADAGDKLKTTLGELSNAKKEILKLNPVEQFDLNAIKNRVVSKLDKDLLAVDEARLTNLLSNIFDEEAARRGNVVNGEILESIKRGLQSRGSYKLQAKELPVDIGSAKAFRQAASVVREELEKGYKDVSELRRLNYIESQYINAIDVLNYLNNRPVQGGVLSKDLAGITGAIIGSSSKLPVVGPMIGKEFAEAVRNRLIDPKRRTRRLVSKMAKKDSETYGQKALQEFKAKSEQYKQTQKIIEQMLKPKFQTPLLESAQMRAQNTLQRGGEIAVSPAGQAKVTPPMARRGSEVALAAENATPKLAPPKTSILRRADGSAVITMPDYKVSTILKPQEVNEMIRAGMLRREGNKLVGGENAFGFAAGIEPELDKNGNPTGKFKFNATKAIRGFAGISAAKKIAPKLAGKGDNMLYHGTAGKIDKFNNALMRGGNQGKGIYLSNNPSIAKYHSFGAKDRSLEKELGRMPYASEKTAGEVLDVKVKPGANIKKLDYTPTGKEVNALKKQGFDGVDFADEVVLEEWNPKIHGEYPKKGASRTTMIFDANNVKIIKTAQ